MLSYRHGYHAGNHADVVKHLVLLGLLQRLLDKEKPFSCIDTHAGAGLYDIESAAARLNEEHASGIAALWQHRALNPLLSLYLERVAAFNADGVLRRYPGSPALSLTSLRGTDHLQLIELHPAEVEALRYNFGRDSRVSIHERDSFEGLQALTPPEPRRGMALIDPAYEDKADYQRVVTAITRTHRRWPVGIIALWYPLLARQRDRSAWLTAALVREKLPGMLSIELVVEAQQEEFGMHGSGMLIVNAPWQFADQMRATLDEVSSVLGAGVSGQIKALTPEG